MMFFSDILLPIIGILLFVVVTVKFIRWLINNIPAREPKAATQDDIIVAIIIILCALGRF